MQAVQSSAMAGERSSRLMMVAGFAAAVGAASFAINVGDAFSGEVPALGRMLVGIVGVAGGALLWMRPKLGWTIVLAWAFLQIPFIAWNTDGNLTTQLIDIPATMGSSTSVNGEVTEYSEFGINLIGVIIAIVVYRFRNAWLLQNR